MKSARVGILGRFFVCKSKTAINGTSCTFAKIRTHYA